MTNLQQQMKDLQEQIIRTDYYVDLYHNCLYAASVCPELVKLGHLENDKIVELANDFWIALPDDPAIRRAPFFLLCDIAEHCFDGDCVGEGY